MESSMNKDVDCDTCLCYSSYNKNRSHLSKDYKTENGSPRSMMDFIWAAVIVGWYIGLITASGIAGLKCVCSGILPRRKLKDSVDLVLVKDNMLHSGDTW